MITIVSGLPRSGTSLLMQMLHAGGLPILTDGIRTADEDNPRGYYEWERIKQLPREPGLIVEAEGKGVKVISSLLSALPIEHQYRVVLMRRPISEILASQGVMIQHKGTAGAAVPAAVMARALQANLASALARVERQPKMAVLPVEYHRLLEDPPGEAERIQQFLGSPLDTAAMARAVDPSLHRQRT